MYIGTPSIMSEGYLLVHNKHFISRSISSLIHSSIGQTYYYYTDITNGSFGSCILNSEKDVTLILTVRDKSVRSKILHEKLQKSYNFIEQIDALSNYSK